MAIWDPSNIYIVSRFVGFLTFSPSVFDGLLLAIRLVYHDDVSHLDYQTRSLIYSATFNEKER